MKNSISGKLYKKNGQKTQMWVVGVGWSQTLKKCFMAYVTPFWSKFFGKFTVKSQIYKIDRVPSLKSMGWVGGFTSLGLFPNKTVFLRLPEINVVDNSGGWSDIFELHIKTIENCPKPKSCGVDQCYGLCRF